MVSTEDGTGDGNGVVILNRKGTTRANISVISNESTVGELHRHTQLQENRSTVVKSTVGFKPAAVYGQGRSRGSKNRTTVRRGVIILECTTADGQRRAAIHINHRSIAGGGVLDHHIGQLQVTPV